jgi:hypothetical protein
MRHRYALIMSISNLGGVIGTQLGAGITLGLGVTGLCFFFLSLFFGW